MQTTTTAISDLSSDPANARSHSKANLDAIAGSLRRFGQQKPIVVDSSGVVRAGNGTLAAAKLLGWEEIEVVHTELEGSEATAFAIADNRTAELADWDDDVLAASLHGLDEELQEAAGFVGKELDEILASLKPKAVIEDKAPDVPEEAETLENYAFSGVTNVARVGTPVPIAYGRLFVGSSVISSGLDVDQVV